MDVARTSMIHAAAPHFQWPFAVQYVAHQINLQPRVSLPETTPTLGDASAFHVWGSRDFVRDTSANKLSSRAVPSVFLGFPPDAPGWQFYHPTLRRFLSSQDVTFDESVSYYRVSQVDPAEPVEVAVDSGAARGAEPAGAGTGGAEPGGAEPERVKSGGAEPERVEPGGAEPERVESRGAALERVEPWGAEPGGAEPMRAKSGGSPGVLLRREPLSSQRLREWYARRSRCAAGAAGGAAGAGAARGAAGAGAAGGAAGAGAAGSAVGARDAGGATGAGAPGGAAGPGGAPTGGTGAAGAGGAAGVGPASTGAGGAAGVVAGDLEGTGAVSAVSGGAARPQPYYVSILLQVLGLQPSPGPPPPLLSPTPVLSQSQLQPASPLPGPSPYSGPPTVTRFLATAVTHPLFESTAVSALVAKLVDFPSACRLDYATSLVAESASACVCLPCIGGECALGTDVLEDSQEEFECFAATVPHLVSMLLDPKGDPDAPDIPTPRSYVEAIEGPYSSQWQAAMDAEMASWKSTGTYVNEVPPHGANIVSGMWIFRVKRPPGSPPAFKARYVARGFSTAARDYELHSLDFSTFFLQGSLHEEIWLHRPPGFTGSFPVGTQWSLLRPVYGLRQAPREWHDTLRTTLATLGFAPSIADPSLFLRIDTNLPPFYVLVNVDDLVFATADTEALAHVKSELTEHPTSRRVLFSQDVTFDEVLLDAFEPIEVVVDSGASGGAKPELAEPGGAGSGGAEPESAEPGVAESGGALSRRELPSPQELRKWFARRWSHAAGAGGGAGAGGSTAAGGTGAGGAAGAGAAGSTSTGGARATGPGGARTGGTGAAGPGRAPGAAEVGATGAGAAVSAGGPAGAGAAGGTGAGGAAGVGADAGGAGVVPAGSGGAARPQPYFVPLLEQVLGIPPCSSPAPSIACPPPVQSESQLQLASPLPAPSPYAGPSGGLAERREPESRPASPVRTARTSRRVPRTRPPAVPGTHQMALRPSSAPQRVPLPSPPESSLPALADPESDSLRAASPTVARFLATAATDHSFESAATSAFDAELVDFAANCRLDYATSLVAESASFCPPSVGGECALSTDVLEDRQEEFQCFAAALPPLLSMLLALEGDPVAPDIPTPRSYAEAIEGPYSSQWQAAMDAEMASWKSTGTYVDEVPPPGANIRQGVDYFQTFSPTSKMTTLRVLLHVAAQCDYELHSLDCSTAFLQGSLHEEIWLRRPPGFTGSFPLGTQWSLRRPVYSLRQAPCEWHDTLRTTLAAFGFAPSTADASLFLRTDALLPMFYILVYVDDLVFATGDTAGLAHMKSELQKRHTCTDLGELRSYLGLQITRDRARRTITLTQSHMVQQILQRFDFTNSSPQATPLSTRHSLSALPSDESVEQSGPYPELVGCLMYLMTCTRPDLAYPFSILACYVAPGRHRPEHMAAAMRVLRYLCSTLGMGLVLGGRSPVVLTGHADTSWVDDLATQRSSQGYTFSLGSGSVLWRSTRSSSFLSSSCEAEIYAGAMAAQELCWLTYLLTDLGEPPHSPPVLYVDNKAMSALCREHRLEHRTMHIALRYFLSRELQQRGQLHLAYVASQANTADIFTKALQPCDHQRFCTMLGLVPTWPHLLTS
ncbi:unnamed protein product [Closterium sp. NIES-54]